MKIGGMKFLGVQDLMQLLGRSESYCYKVIRELNQELKKKGYMINPGRIPEQYFYERCYYSPEDRRESPEDRKGA